QAVAAQGRHEFDIRRQPLDAALVEFSRQTGYHVARLTDPNTPLIAVGPVRGIFAATEALSMLLQCTGYTYSFINEHTIAILNRLSDPEDSRSQGPSALAAQSSPAKVMSRPAQEAVGPPTADETPRAPLGEVVV